MMLRLALIAVALLAASTSPAAARQCLTEGKSYRIIEGRRCWFTGTRHLSKSELYWATGPARRATAKGERRRGRLSRVAIPMIPMPTQEPLPPEPPEPTPTKVDLNAALQARAQDLHAALMAPKIVRTVLINPIELQAPPDIPPTEVPMPRPRPEIAPPRPLIAPAWALILALLMLGNAGLTRFHEGGYR
jgi:hypothetical protein